MAGAAHAATQLRTVVGALAARVEDQVALEQAATAEAVVKVHHRARAVVHDVALDDVLGALELRVAAGLLLPDAHLAAQVEGDDVVARLVAVAPVVAVADGQTRVAAVRVAPRRDGGAADPRELVVRNGRVAIVRGEHDGVAWADGWVGTGKSGGAAREPQGTTQPPPSPAPTTIPPAAPSTRSNTQPVTVTRSVPSRNTTAERSSVQSPPDGMLCGSMYVYAVSRSPKPMSAMSVAGAACVPVMLNRCFVWTAETSDGGGVFGVVELYQNVSCCVTGS